MSIIKIWNQIYDRLRELELAVLLNGVQDGAILQRIKQLLSLAQLIQVGFDEQNFRRVEPHASQLQTARMRQIAAVLRDMESFVPQSAQKFKNEIRQTQTVVEQFLTFDIDQRKIDNVEIMRSYGQKSLYLGGFVGKSKSRSRSGVRKSRSGSTCQTRAPADGIELTQYEPRSDRSLKSLTQLDINLMNEESRAVKQTQLENQCCIEELQQQVSELKMKLSQKQTEMQLKLEMKDREIAALQQKLSDAQVQSEGFRNLSLKTQHESEKLYDQISMLSNEVKLKVQEIEALKTQLDAQREECTKSQIESQAKNDEL